MRRVIEWIGTHPFATGLLALVGLFGTLLGFYDIWSSSETEDATRVQLNEISETTERSVQTIAETNTKSAEISEKIDGLAEQLQSVEATIPTAKDGFIPAVIEMPYDLARPKLLEAGWMPLQTRWQSVKSWESRRQPIWNHGFEEVVACAGTGRAECRFEFHNGAQDRLVVITFGEIMGELNDTGRAYVGRPNFGNFKVGSAFIESGSE